MPELSWRGSNHHHWHQRDDSQEANHRAVGRGGELPATSNVTTMTTTSTMTTTGIVVKTILLGDSGVGKSSIATRFVNDEFSPYMDSTVGADYHTKTLQVREEQQQQQQPQQQQQQEEKEKEDYSTQPLTLPPSSATTTRIETTTRPVTFTIWDTAGQEKFRSLMPMYYRGVQVAIFVFDLTKPHTLISLNSWVEELNLHSQSSPSSTTMLIAICGNKADLEQPQVVPTERTTVDQSLSETIPDSHIHSIGSTSPLLSLEGVRLANKLGAIYMEVSAKDSTNVDELFQKIGRRVLERYDDIARTSCNAFGVVDLSACSSNTSTNEDDGPGGCC